MDWKKYLWPEWTIEYEIGAGSYGTVYKIIRQDISGTYDAALKVIRIPYQDAAAADSADGAPGNRPEKGADRELAEKIGREFALMERLKGHTNIVSYEDHKIVCPEDGEDWLIFIRMELLTPFREYYASHSFTEKEVLALGEDICSALVLCEKYGIVHRDVKPGNIFVNENGDYKLGDFGLAEVIDRRMSLHSPIGTYAFMAPEVAKGENYGRNIDGYSLGMILYLLLNDGRGPFLPAPPVGITQEMAEEANRRRIEGEPLNVPRRASPAAAQVVLRACAYDPAMRYESASELREAIRRCRPEIREDRESLKGHGSLANDSDSEENAHREELPEGDPMRRFFSAAGDL